MKNASRILAAVMLAALLVSVIPTTASAATYSYTATAGDFQYFQFFLDYEDIVEEAFFSNGYIDGMSLSISNDCTVALSGVIENPGYYSVDVVVSTQRAGYYFYTLNITVEPAPVEPPPTDPPIVDPPVVDPPVSSGTPVVTKHPTGETVVEGDSAVFIARADNTRQYIWEIAIADAFLECSELPGYLDGVSVSGYNTDTLVIYNIPTGMDGAYVWCRFVGAEESAYSGSALLTVLPVSQATPEVTKSPTAETVDEGGTAEFVAKANHYKTCRWVLVSPSGVTYNCADAPASFRGLEVSGSNTEYLTLKNIPASLNGYSVICEFTAGTTVSSGSAKLTVNAAATQPTAAAAAPAQPTVPVETAVPTETMAEAGQTSNDNKGKDKGRNESSADNSAAESPSAVPEADNKPGNTGGKFSEPKSSPTLTIVAIVAAAAVIIAAIAAFVILKLNRGKNSGK